MSALRLNDNILKHCPGARAVMAGKGGWRRFFIAGMAAVLAGLTFLGGIAVLMRYETVMLEGELCIVLDRWPIKAKPCNEEAIVRRGRKDPEPQPAEAPGQEEALWQWVVEFVGEFIEMRWLPMMRPLLSANR